MLAATRAHLRQQQVVALGARAAQQGIALMGGMAPIADGAICSTLQIGSTP
jgi:hypothetical protein